MKEKYVIVFIIGIVSLLLVGTIGFVNAQEEQEIPTEVGDSWLDRIISNIQSFFHKQDMFTIYGRELSCSIYPDRTVNFVKDEKYYFSTENICGSDDFFVNYFRGEGGHDQYIREIYWKQDPRGAYITDGDGQGSLYLGGYVKCDAGAYWNNKCYAEIYCCDKGVCIRDSDCESDEECDKTTSSISDIFPSFGVCEQEEVSYHTTKVYSCSNGQKTLIDTASKGDINWCPDPDENNYILLDTGGSSGVCYEEGNEPMACTTPKKTCWRIQDNQCDSLSIYTTSCENRGYYSSKAVCEQGLSALTRNCWVYDVLLEECKGPFLQFTTKTCEEIEKYTTEQVCKVAHGLVVNGNGVIPGDEEEPIECIEEEGLFNTDGEFYTKDLNWYLGWETTSGDVVNPGQLDEHFPGFSKRYRENKAVACCEGLEPSLVGEKIREYESGWLFFTGDTGTLTYLEYKCVPEGETGLCLEFAHLLLEPYTHTDCQTNTIILIVLIVVLFLIISRFAGIYGEIKYEI